MQTLSVQMFLKESVSEFAFVAKKISVNGNCMDVTSNMSLTSRVLIYILINIHNASVITHQNILS